MATMANGMEHAPRARKWSRTKRRENFYGYLFLTPWLLGFFVGPFFVLPDLLCIFGAERKCLHDMFADTIVVDA